MKIGVLGGIGVEATGYFYLSLIKRLQESGSIKSNLDYPNLIINSIPAPELHLEEHDRHEIVEPYINGIKELAKLQPDFMIMVCNTIHLYLDVIKAKSGYTNFLSLKDIVKSALDEKRPKKICVLGTGLTITRGLYNFEEYEYVILSEEEQETLCDVVVAFNRDGSSPDNMKIFKEKLLEIVRNKQSDGAEMFLLACTEISEILTKESIPSMDTLELLIDAVSHKIITTSNH